MEVQITKEKKILGKDTKVVFIHYVDFDDDHEKFDKFDIEQINKDIDEILGELDNKDYDNYYDVSYYFFYNLDRLSKLCYKKDDFDLVIDRFDMMNF